MRSRGRVAGSGRSAAETHRGIGQRVDSGHSKLMPLPRQLDENEEALLREALTGRPGWLDLARALEDAANAGGSEALRMLSLAFVYDLVSPQHDSRRAAAGGPYASMMETEDGMYPPRPADVLDEVRSVWRSARERVEDPIVGARVSDLLYVADGRSAHADGRRAAREFAELTQEVGREPLSRAGCMARSIEILVELNDRETLGEVLGAADRVVLDLLGQEHPGPPLIVLRALVGLKKDRRPGGLEALLARTIERFPGGHAGESALELAAEASSDPERQKNLRRRQLQLRIDEAAAAEGLAKVTMLQRAIDLASRFGFAGETEALLKEQQDLPEEDLGFESMEVSIDLPTQEIREQVDLIVGSHAADIFEALRRLGDFGPPGGSHPDIDREVEEQERESPFINLFPHSMFGTETSAPTFLAGTEENKRLASRGRQRQLHADLYGRALYAPMLDEAVDRHGRPSHEELARHFATELIGEVRGERIARALEFFWDEEYDEAAHLIVPRLESILRDVARVSGLPIVRPAEEGRFTGVVSLNVLLIKLRELYETPWFDYLEALLSDPLAINLRNDIAHGIRQRVGGVGAA
ncbi:MAG TPA: DUF4209 domain-containing protein, partial [Solirubrobacterales bacterium]|nr:DUF4209 domain-containing protein [Solirubrobacterales bacterium]